MPRNTQSAFLLFTLLGACLCSPAATLPARAHPPQSPPAAAAVTARVTAPVTATIALHGHDALDVSYRIPAFCKALAFDDPGVSAQAAALVRADWQAADACTEVDFQGIRARHAGCTTLRLRVPASTRARDRRVYDGVHPWAQPLGNGIYAHTAAYAVKATCGPVAWRVEAPGGTVMIDGSVHAGSASRSAAGIPAGGVPALLLPTPYRPDAPPFQAEASIARATRILLASTVTQTLDALHALLPALPLRQGYVLATSSPAPTLDADAPSPDVMRLLVPDQPLPALEAQARRLIAHESAHLAQPAHWNDAWRADTGAIREGGAAFLRLATALRLGWITETQLKDELEAAVNACALGAAGKPWRAFEGRNAGEDAIRCGLALHLVGLAPAPGRPAPLARLQAYYRQARDGAATDFAHGLECGMDAACRARILPRLQGREPLAAVLDEQARTPGSVLHAAPGWGPALIEVMAFGHLEGLVRADCHGGANIAHDRAAPRIGPGLRCKVLQPGMVVSTAEGLPLFEGAAAVQASALACRRSGATVLGLLDGRSVKVACGPTAGLPPAVFGVDAAQAATMMSVAP